INGTEFVNSTPVASPSAIYGFNYTYTVNAQATAGTQAPIQIDVRVYNESTSVPSQSPFYLGDLLNPNVTYPAGVTAPNSYTNPTGFILAGTITPVAVPLPSAASSGLALCAVLGAVKIAKRVRKFA